MLYHGIASRFPFGQRPAGPTIICTRKHTHSRRSLLLSNLLGFSASIILVQTYKSIASLCDGDKYRLAVTVVYRFFIITSSFAERPRAQPRPVNQRLALSCSRFCIMSHVRCWHGSLQGAYLTLLFASVLLTPTRNQRLSRLRCSWAVLRGSVPEESPIKVNYDLDPVLRCIHRLPQRHVQSRCLKSDLGDDAEVGLSGSLCFEPGSRNPFRAPR